MDETDALNKRIETWTQDVLNDELKMAAWVAANKLDASGLLVDEETKRIAAKVRHEKLLDELLGEPPVAVTSPLRSTQSIGRILRSNKLSGKSATQVWIDEDWQGAHDRSKY